ncbi:hypothetical protein BH23PLA1_BH23PLA1_30470 [soil metagenome]
MTPIPGFRGQCEGPFESPLEWNGRRWVWLLLLAVSGCAMLQPEARPLVPTRHRTTAGPFTLFTGDPEPPQAAVAELEGLERNLEATLGLKIDPAAPPIEIYILDDEQAFSTFLRHHHPELPNRRAFFLARGTRRVIYTSRGDRLIEDLRHEATHALLHATIGNVPLWLDEGLAEYFEAPPDDDPGRASRLLLEIASGREPDLLRLEALEEIQAMGPGDYRESWAWTHYLLQGSPAAKQTLLGYLADLRGPTVPEPLSQRLEADAEILGAEFLAHLRGLGDRSTAEVARFQDAPNHPAQSSPVRVLVQAPAPSSAPVVVPVPAPMLVPNPDRPGLFRRFGDRLGALADRFRASPPREFDQSWPPG